MKEFWNERYDEAGFAYGTDPNDFLVSVIDEVPKGKVLCLADGEGRNSVYLARKGFDVTMVDYSEAGVYKAKQLAEKNSVQIEAHVADLSEFRIEENCYSAIVSIFCHLPNPLRDRVYKDSIAGLKDQGVLILEAFSEKQLDYDSGGPRSTDLLYNFHDMMQVFGKLELEESREIVRELNEGKYHNGMASVIQIFARKTNSHTVSDKQ